MIRLIALLVCVSLWSGPALSAEVRIKSGEHSNFTRLVFYHDQNDSPQVENMLSGVRLTFEARIARDSYDKIFKLITRTRIADVEINDRSATISFNCKCDVASTQLSDKIFVLDILTPLASVEVKKIGEHNQNASDNQIRRDYGENFGHGIVDSLDDSGNEILGDIKFQKANSDFAGGDVKSIVFPFYSKLGFLTREHTLGIASPLTQNLNAGEIRPPSDIGDYVSSKFSDRLVETKSSDTCSLDYIESLLDFFEVGGLGYDSIGDLFANALNARFEADSAVHIKLAKFFISKSFFEEAELVLQSLVDDEKSNIIREMIKFLRGLDSSFPTIVTSASSCGPTTRFWSALSGEPQSQTSAARDPEFYTTFTQLPQPLQKILIEKARGVALLVAPDESDDFFTVRDKIIKGAGKVDHSDYHISLDRSSQSLAIHLPSNLIDRAGGGMTSSATSPLSEDDVITAESMISTLRGDPSGDEIVNALFDRYVSDRSWPEAIQLISASDSGNFSDPELVRNLQSKIVGVLTENATAIEIVVALSDPAYPKFFSDLNAEQKSALEDLRVYASSELGLREINPIKQPDLESPEALGTRKEERDLKTGNSRGAKESNVQASRPDRWLNYNRLLDEAESLRSEAARLIEK